jgi:hypothetical protein
LERGAVDDGVLTPACLFNLQVSFLVPDAWWLDSWPARRTDAKAVTKRIVPWIRLTMTFRWMATMELFVHGTSNEAHKSRITYHISKQMLFSVLAGVMQDGAPKASILTTPTRYAAESSLEPSTTLTDALEPLTVTYPPLLPVFIQLALATMIDAWPCF